MKNTKKLEHYLKILENKNRVSSKNTLPPNKCREGGFEPEGFSDLLTDFSCIFQYVFVLEKESGRVVSSLEVFFSIIFIFILWHCSIFFSGKKQILEKYQNKYRKKIRKTLQAPNHPPGKTMVPIHDLLLFHCILFKQNKILEKTGKKRKHFGNKYPKNILSSKQPSRLRFTVLRELHHKKLVTRIEHTVQQWDASSLHKCKQ